MEGRTGEPSSLRGLQMNISPIAQTERRAPFQSPSLLVGWAVAVLLLLLLLAGAGGAQAATMTFGSQLSAPATLDTAANLGYPGYGIPTIANNQAIVVHINHDAADTALWNAAPAAPDSGQVVSVSLEGCAKPSLGGPAPLTQIHFQDLVPQANGGVKVNVTTQAFNVPVCGQGGADGSTVTTYEPTNFCVTGGDYVDFNDEGGFNPGDPLAYPSGVPYEVLGAVRGSTMDSFIANNAVGNGATFSPGVISDRNGFASNQEEELMLQATLATGPDASTLCPGGTKGKLAPGAAVPGSAGSAWHGRIPTVTLPKQVDGVNRRGFVLVAIYCHTAITCTGTLTLHFSSHRLGASGGGFFSVPSLHTGKVAVHLNLLAQRLVRHAGGRLTVEVTLTPSSGSDTHPLTEPITLRGWH
jgi:hypothetical protein